MGGWVRERRSLEAGKNLGAEFEAEPGGDAEGRVSFKAPSQSLILPWFLRLFFMFGLGCLWSESRTLGMLGKCAK